MLVVCLTDSMMDRLRQEELVFVLQNLLSLRLREGVYSASLSPDPSSFVQQPPLALDTSLPLPQLVRSIVLRSPLAHLYELHSMLTSLLMLSTVSPSITSAYIPQRLLVIEDSEDALFKGLPEGFNIRRLGKPASLSSQEEGGERLVTDVVALVLRCLDRVGKEIGSSI